MITAVSAEIGRPDDGTDATGFFNAGILCAPEARVGLARGPDKAKLTDDDERRSVSRNFPAVEFNFSQNIEDNVEEAASGVKGENSVKLFGNDLAIAGKDCRPDPRMKWSEFRSRRSGGAQFAGPADHRDLDRIARVQRGSAWRRATSMVIVQAAIGGQAAGNLL